MSRSPYPPPKIARVASSTPPHELAQDEVKAFAAAHFAPHLPETSRLLPVFDHAGIERRRFSAPIEWFRTLQSFSSRNDRFLADAMALAEDAVDRLLRDADLAPEDVDHLVFVTSTGLATPTIDARLIGRLGLRSDTARTPLFGLGCAGGALGLAHAADLLAARPHGRLVLVNVELCGLTFLQDDYSKSNLVATALFGDAVSAALVVGGAVDGPGLEIVDQGTYLWPDTLDVMGWNFQNHGMQVVFSSRIPALVRASMAGCLSGFLARSGRALDSIAHWLVHPGGRRVLEAYGAALELEPDRLAIPRRVLAEHGNCSAVTVMRVIEEFLRGRAFEDGDLAVATALGPGFSAGNLLLRVRA